MMNSDMFPDDLILNNIKNYLQHKTIADREGVQIKAWRTDVMVQSFQSLMLMSSSNTRAQNTVTFKSFTKAYCLLLDATDIWEYKYK